MGVIIRLRITDSYLHGASFSIENPKLKLWILQLQIYYYLLTFNSGIVTKWKLLFSFLNSFIIRIYLRILPIMGSVHSIFWIFVCQYVFILWKNVNFQCTILEYRVCVRIAFEWLPICSIVFENVFVSELPVIYRSFSSNFSSLSSMVVYFWVRICSLVFFWLVGYSVVCQFVRKIAFVFSWCQLQFFSISLPSGLSEVCTYGEWAFHFFRMIYFFFSVSSSSNVLLLRRIL